jgi:hypothetical protein
MTGRTAGASPHTQQIEDFVNGRQNLARMATIRFVAILARFWHGWRPHPVEKLWGRWNIFGTFARLAFLPSPFPRWQVLPGWWPRH